MKKNTRRKHKDIITPRDKFIDLEYALKMAYIFKNFDKDDPRPNMAGVQATIVLADEVNRLRAELAKEQRRNSIAEALGAKKGPLPHKYRFIAGSIVEVHDGLPKRKKLKPGHRYPEPGGGSDVCTGCEECWT
jgi:hypothetical protein